jgi:hypothetical protein
VFLAGMVWLVYVALEPFLRSRWPGAMISWSRLLAGRLRDPLVGRDILVGACWGFTLLLLIRLSTVASMLFDLPPSSPGFHSASVLLGGRRLLNHVLEVLFVPLLIAGGLLFLLLILRVVLRKHWLAVGAMIALLSIDPILQQSGEPLFLLELAVSVVFWAGTYLLLARFGVLSVYFAFFFLINLESIPSVDFSQWYAGNTIVLILIMAAIVGYAFHASLAGRSLFSDSAVPGG